MFTSARKPKVEAGALRRSRASFGYFLVSLWLALRASVLRRAVSQSLSAQGRFRAGFWKVCRNRTVAGKRQLGLQVHSLPGSRGRGQLQPKHSLPAARTTATNRAAQPILVLASCNSVLGSAGQHLHRATRRPPAVVLANPSFNRTHCGVPPFAPPFHSGANVITPQRAG